MRKGNKFIQIKWANQINEILARLLERLIFEFEADRSNNDLERLNNQD